MFDLTVLELAQYADEVQSAWNGDEPGYQEERATKAQELAEHLAAINALYKELQDEYYNSPTN